ncbi:hypothetical protein C7N43_33370 [Sphingobacteriales bacterium UPWRP_1]|nr:hypothetical protein C7N43_33370 [Sphingobacteriales bacterium UPWRP_1]
MKNVLFFIAVLCFTFYSSLQAQNITPVKWNVSAQELGNNEFLLSFDAKIDKGWYIYSQHVEGPAPIPTTITFNKNAGFKLIGSIAEFGQLINNYDEFFEKNIRKFANKVSFQARVKTLTPETKVTGTLEFMACNNSRCLPPAKQVFDFNLVATNLDNMLAKEMEAGKFIDLKSKQFADDNYAASDVEYKVGMASPVDVTSGNEEEEINYRATASRKKAPALSKTDVFNEEKAVDLDNLSSDLLVAANAGRFIKGKTAKPEQKTAAPKPATTKPLAQAQTKPATPKVAPQPFINPVTWDFGLNPVEGNIYELTFTASIEDGWYIYAQNNSGSAPMPVSFTFDQNSGIAFVENEVNENGQLLTEKDPVFEKTVNRYSNTVTFTRKVKFLENVQVSGGVKYMAANNKQYLMPKEVRFNFNNSLLIPVNNQQEMAASIPNPLGSHASGNNWIWMSIAFLSALGLVFFIRKVSL